LGEGGRGGEQCVGEKDGWCCQLAHSRSG
jgi:hypothetical protein